VSTIGGFVGWYPGDFWVNGQLSWTRVSYEVDRRVQLGAAVRSYQGSPDGDNLTFAANAGWNFHRGALTHGPVIGVISQRVEVDGFRENRVDSAGLAYPAQDYGSTIGSAGWQASFTINDHVTPYARLAWEHEFEDAPSEAFAQSLTVTSLPYAVPGLADDDNAGTMLFGVRTRVWGVDTNVGAMTSVGEAGGNYATVFVTFGNRF
jgi:outer membrane lipase/esterase